MNIKLQNASGLYQLTHAQIQRKIAKQKLFGLDDIENYLFKFCQAFLTANPQKIEQFSIYDLAPSVLLYGPPNTGKTTLCYELFDRLKQEVTNEINFYTVSIGGILDPNLGQSSRNIEQIFEDLKKICSDNSAVFLLLDELDAFCMSRSRTQEHDAVRRAMTSLMLELDALNSSSNQKLLVFGVTNVPQLLDTAIVRRFSLKQLVDAKLSEGEFREYVEYLSKPINKTCQTQELQKLYNLYQERQFTTGDIKGLYKVFLVDLMCGNSQDLFNGKIVEIFEKGFSTGEHLQETYKEVSNV